MMLFFAIIGVVATCGFCLYLSMGLSSLQLVYERRHVLRPRNLKDGVLWVLVWPWCLGLWCAHECGLMEPEEQEVDNGN